MLFGVLLESLAVALGPAQQARRLHTDTTTAASQTQVAECSINLHDRMLTLPAGTLATYQRARLMLEEVRALVDPRADVDGLEQGLQLLDQM